MAFDYAEKGHGGGDCWRCGGIGWYTQSLSTEELRRIVPIPPGAEVIEAHATVRCQECNSHDGQQ